MSKPYPILVIMFFPITWLILFIGLNFTVPLNGWLPVFFQDWVFQSWIDNDKSLFDVFIQDGYKFTFLTAIITVVFIGLFKVKH